MKHIFNWTVGSFFRTLGRIFAYLAIGCLIAFVFSYKPKAATLSSKAVYTNGYWYKSDFNNWGSNNTFSYGLAPFSSQGKAYYNVGNINTTYTGKAYQLAFGFQYNLTAQKYYDITINFKSRDLTNNLNTSGVSLVSGSSSSTLYDTNVLSLIGVTNTATTGNNTNKLVVRIFAVQPISYWVLELSSDPNNLTSVNNFGISSITIDEVDTTNSQEIINNQTNNTQNIINNQNNNTQQIIDSTRVCSDIDRASVYEVGFTLDGDGNKIAGNNERGITNYINIQSSELTLLSKTDMIGAYVCFYNVNKSLISCSATRDMSLGLISIPNNSVYMRATIFIPEDKPTFKLCQNGNQATTNAIDNLNDTLTDDKTNDSDIASALNNIDVPQTSYGPFQAFLTIPLQWVQTILAAGQTCQTLHLPLPFVNSYLDLPCMTDFWNATGILGVLIQAVWIAVVAVRIFNGLFMLTVETLNTSPDSAVELTKIKSWEL